MLGVRGMVAHNERKGGRGAMQNPALSAEAATHSPGPSRTRYQGVELPFTQRGSPWGRAAKNKDYEDISMLVFSFS